MPEIDRTALAAILTGFAPDAPLESLAAGFFAMGAKAVLLIGGHADGSEAVDWLLRPGCTPLWFAAQRKRGTRRSAGCTLATAIAAHLSLGDDQAKACDHAKRCLSPWW